MIAAMTYLGTGACPAAAAQRRLTIDESEYRLRDRRGSPEREFADAY